MKSAKSSTPNGRWNIAEVKAATDLVDLVREYGVELKQRGIEFVGLCPFHDDTTPSFNVNRDKQVYQVPGSHLFGYEGNLEPQALWGLTDDEVPCVAPDNTPGDVLVFNPNTLHNSLGGATRRRMLNFMGCRRPANEAEQSFLDGRSRQPLDFPDQVRITATAERRRHLYSTGA